MLAALIGATYVAAGVSRFATSMTVIAGLALIGAVAVWLPRAAHKAFVRGDHARAALWYQVLRALSLDGEARASIAVSLAACDLGRERYDRALARLGRVDTDALSEATECALLNNRAYALARSGGDAGAALVASERAVALRPHVPGFRHTRGLALLALGRVDDAIRELDAVWDALDGDDPPPLLEAERCCDLAAAWARKGERDYARDYLERAQRAAPASPWAARAAAELGETRDRASSVALPELA